MDLELPLCVPSKNDFDYLLIKKLMDRILSLMENNNVDLPTVQTLQVLLDPLLIKAYFEWSLSRKDIIKAIVPKPNMALFGYPQSLSSIKQASVFWETEPVLDGIKKIQTHPLKVDEFTAALDVLENSYQIAQYFHVLKNILDNYLILLKYAPSLSNAGLNDFAYKRFEYCRNTFSNNTPAILEEMALIYARHVDENEEIDGNKAFSLTFNQRNAFFSRPRDNKPGLNRCPFRFVAKQLLSYGFSSDTNGNILLVANQGIDNGGVIAAIKFKLDSLESFHSDRTLHSSLGAAP